MAATATSAVVRLQLQLQLMLCGCCHSRPASMPQSYITWTPALSQMCARSHKTPHSLPLHAIWRAV